MAGVNIDDFGASFIHYLPGVVKILNNTSKARLLPKGKHKWEGINIQKYVHVKRNAAIAAVQDGGAIPAAGKQTYVPLKAYRKFIVGSVKVTDGVLNNAATTKNAAIAVVESELRGMLDGTRRWENFFFTRDGTGVVGLLGAAASSTATIQMDDARLMWDDAYYSILDTNGTTEHATFKCASTARAFSSGLAQVTASAATAANSSATNDYVVWRGSTAAGTSSYNQVPMGLDGMIDDNTGTFQAINCDTYTRYTSPVLSNGGTARALQPRLFRQALAAIKSETGDDPPQGMSVLTNQWGSMNVEEMYEGELRISETTKVAGIEIAAFQSTLGRVNIVDDDQSPYGKMFFVDFGEITRAVQKEMDWRKQKGGGIFRPLDNSLNWVANCLEICEFFIERRNRCAKIEDISENKITAFA